MKAKTEAEKQIIEEEKAQERFQSFRSNHEEDEEAKSSK